MLTVCWTLPWLLPPGMCVCEALALHSVAEAETPDAPTLTTPDDDCHCDHSGLGHREATANGEPELPPGSECAPNGSAASALALEPVTQLAALYYGLPPPDPGAFAPLRQPSSSTTHVFGAAAQPRLPATLTHVSLQL